MSRGQFFLLLTTLGVSAGIATLLLSRPVDRIVGEFDRAKA
jgi:hypothetical protein